MACVQVRGSGLCEATIGLTEDLQRIVRMAPKDLTLIVSIDLVGSSLCAEEPGVNHKVVVSTPLTTCLCFVTGGFCVHVTLQWPRLLALVKHH